MLESHQARNFLLVQEREVASEASSSCSQKPPPSFRVANSSSDKNNSASSRAAIPATCARTLTDQGTTSERICLCEFRGSQSISEPESGQGVNVLSCSARR